MYKANHSVNNEGEKEAKQMESGEREERFGIGLLVVLTDGSPRWNDRKGRKQKCTRGLVLRTQVCACQQRCEIRMPYESLLRESLEDFLHKDDGELQVNFGLR